MRQTAVVIDIGGGREVLVRVQGVHVPPDFIQADMRLNGGTWTPVAFEVRAEGDQ